MVTALKKLERPADLFAADKVWIANGGEGRAQMEVSRQHFIQLTYNLADREAEQRLLPLGVGA